MRRARAALLALALATLGRARGADAEQIPAVPEPAPATAAPFDHSAWSRLLARYVDGPGRVAYRDLAANDRAALSGYLAALASAQPGAWSRADRIAFWLNAYNAAIVQAVLEDYSAESLLGRYSMFFRYRVNVAGEERTPDAIENRVVRPAGENRIHFALVCASSSCPRLRRQAWQGATLEADLDEETRRFVRDPERNQIRAGQPLRLSRIFDWYDDDFGGSAESVRQFLARYVEAAEQRGLLEQKPEIEYLDYDWTMNAQPGQRP